mgnify:FL=1|jgi:uncharacterized protein (TIGR00255 family)
MTGFARVDGAHEGLAWTFEARSVNGKGLDLRCRLPQGYDALEPVAREAAAARMARGNINLTLSLKSDASRSVLRVNEEAFAAVTAIVQSMNEQRGIAPPTLDGLLRLPGVLETGAAEAELPDEARLAQLSASLAAAFDALAADRAAEGGRLVAVLTHLLDEIEELVGRAAVCDGAQPTVIRDRLMRQIAELTEGRTPVSEERLAQEVTLLITRADVREEIDRLKGHIAATRELLSSQGAPGRRLGFLAQELLREANTLCSKSSEQELTSVGLDLKVAIDRLREQALNLE